jgi:hypothetical protein
MTTSYKATARVLACAAFFAGCAKPSPAPIGAPAAANASVASVAQPGLTSQDAPQEKRPRFGDAAVYVDGKSVGVIRVLELPPSLKPHPTKLGSGDVVPRFWMSDYVKSMGIDASKVRGVHVYGGSRVAALDGAEFRRIGDRLMFSFTAGERGKPRLHWPSEPIHVSTTVDMISSLTIYVDKEPPAPVAGGALAFADGKPIDGVPYAQSEQGNGTRVYVDGKLVATMKRKSLTNDLLVPGGNDAKFSLAAYLAPLLKGAGGTPRAIDLVRGDDVVGRFDAATMGDVKTVSFSVPSHSRGMVLVEMPKAQCSAKVSAVELFVKTNPPARPIDTSAQAADSDGDHAPGANRGGDDSTGE